MVLRIVNRKNILLFYLLNLIRRFILFISLFCRSISIFYLGNIIKLGLFPFTYIILLFYVNLNIYNFIIVNTAKLPYLTLIISVNLNLIKVITTWTIMYVMYSIYNTNSLILMLTLYSILSTVIILNLTTAKMLNIYYLIRLLSMYLCLICKFEAIRIYNLISLPFSLTFYIKIQFLLSLKFRTFVVFLMRLTFITLNIMKYIIYISNTISKKIISLLCINILLV